MSWRASSGLRSWLAQRLSALYIAIFLIIFVFVWGGQSISYEMWRQWLSHPLANIATLLFFTAILVHAWIGVRDVIIDYVHSVAAKYVLLMVIGLGLIGLWIWVLRVLFRVQIT